MQDRRHSVRDRVLLGGVAEINESGSTMDCVVRNLSDRGACVELESSAELPDQMRVTIARKGRSYLGRMIWRQANRVGLAFKTMVTDAPVDDLDVRLRRSEAKKRQLQRRIKELLGEG
jgi:PilZ domain